MRPGDEEGGAGPPVPDPALEPPDGGASGDDPLGSRSIALYFKDTLSMEGEPVITTAARPPAPALPREGKRYRLISELGRGGFATVYLVYDEQLKRTVALKVLRLAGRGRGTIERFFDEARSTAQLEHPNIVPVYDVGELKSIPFYTMKFVRGRSFASVFQALRAGDPGTTHEWTPTRLVQVLLQIAMAAHYAHEKGFVHRDLKPANVMLGAFGEVLVMDWGLSHAIARAEGKRGLLGTPVYMSPEQATGRLDEVDARTDVYALGVMLYEALTLRRPFEGRDIHKLLREIATQPPPAPAEHVRGRQLPTVLAAIALRALAKDKLTRHATARAFHDDLQAWLEADTERRRRSALSAARLDEGTEKLRRYRDLQTDLERAEDEVRALRSRFRGPEPLPEKAPIATAEDRVRLLRRERVRLSSGAMSSLTEALAFDPANPEARSRIAEYYLMRLEEAEGQGDAEGRAFFAELVARHDGGVYRERLRDEAVLTIATDPPGLKASLRRFVEDGFVLRPVPQSSLAVTPLLDLPLACGSYVLHLETRAGMVSAPVEIERGVETVLHVRGDLEPPPGFALVPAGAFRSGHRPSVRRACSDFAIALHPVTIGEYAGFIAWLLARDPEEARARAPRLRPEGPPLLTVAVGQPVHIAPSARPQQAPLLSPACPVFGVSWHDARAYAAWLGDRLGVRLDLPSSLEWEKAARGVDGRRYPWGDRFDPALANMKLSMDPPQPVPVSEFPTDESPYGARGMAGNVRDWCADAAEEGDESLDERVVRGGAWSLGASCVELASQGGLAADATSSQIGFRLVWRP